MTTRDALSIAIPALALLAVLWLPGQPRWLGKPLFAKGPPHRTPIAALFALMLIIATARALT